MIREVWTHRNLLVALVRRNYQLRYRQSLVGFAWALLPPLLALGVGAILFGGIIDVETGKTRYEIFAMAAIVPWTLFANSVTQGIPSIVGSLSMVTRLAFPRAVLPLSIVGLSLLDLAVTAVAFLVLAYTLGDGLHLSALWAPLLLMIELPMIVGVVLFWSALNVFARDVRVAVPIVVQFLLLLTPVYYPLKEIPSSLRGLFLINPMTGLVESFREVLVFGRAPELGLLLTSAAGALILLVVGWGYFKSTEPRFADVI